MKHTVESFIGSKAEFDKGGSGFIFGVNEKGGMQMIGEVRGWGAIQNMFDTETEAEEFQDELGKWIADAINQKLNKTTTP